MQWKRKSFRALSPVNVEFNFLFCLFSICRPLPSEMVRYAREDTHYLLYICDRLHNELITKGNANSNLLQSVYSRSKDVCLKVCSVGLGSLVLVDEVHHDNRRLAQSVC